MPSFIYSGYPWLPHSLPSQCQPTCQHLDQAEQDACAIRLTPEAYHAQ